MDWLRKQVSSLLKDAGFEGFAVWASAIVVEFAGSPKPAQIVSWQMGVVDLCPISWVVPHGGRMLLWGLTANLLGDLHDYGYGSRKGDSDVFVHLRVVRLGSQGTESGCEIWCQPYTPGSDDEGRGKSLSKAELDSYLILEGGDLVGLNALPRREKSGWNHRVPIRGLYRWSSRDAISACIAPLPDP